MDYLTFIKKAERLVFEHLQERLEEQQSAIAGDLTEEDVYIVWFSKALKNWKAMVSTTLPDGMYYEVTHNGELHETYIDCYSKVENVVVKDDPIEKLRAKLS